MLYVVDIVVIAAVATGLIALTRGNRRRRIAAAQSWSADNDMQYQPLDASLADLYPGDPFDTGLYRNVENVLTGSAFGRPVRVFDLRITYSAWVPSLRLKRAVLSVVSLQLPVALPSLKVSRTSTLLPQHNDGGLARIVIGDQSFDDTYRVFTDDEAFARDVLNAEMRAWLLAEQARAWLIHGSDVVTWRFGKSYSGGHPEQAMSLAPFLQAVIERLPPVVWQKAGLRPASG